jgi:DNA helicase-2/ATP-dependent DNA helicase PcrA
MVALNPAQAEAVQHGSLAPLLVIAGAGSGKTNTLAHRVAHLVLEGIDPQRILLLTFTRRAAAEMTRRAERIVANAQAGKRSDVRWSGTFHGVANRLLRLHGESIRLDPSFTVLDRSDSADLMNLVRNELGLAKRARRFPKKSTCLSIYSRTVSTQRPLEQNLDDAFPWCIEWEDDLRELFRGYVEAKQERRVLDYDDLLLYWYYLMAEPELAAQVRERFDHVLVDEYQDTNAIQAAILMALKPDGAGLTVVGDDAQSIYSFRAASVRNILDFPSQFPVPARVVTLEQNYRSTQPILDAANAVIDEAPERYAKRLFSLKESEQKPVLATVQDELAQVDYVIERVLAARESGIDLKRQAVLFRTSHHSDALEVELGRRNIPFVKFGGLKFLESAHIKDLLCFLRWVENPSDTVAAFRVLQLVPGVGPAAARKALDHAGRGPGAFDRLAEHVPPTAARATWPGLCNMMRGLADAGCAWRGQVARVRTWYDPMLVELYDSAHVRRADLEQLEQISGEYPSRERFLSEITLDPPASTSDLAGDPHLDEDYLILSTIHSAKGQEWDSVYILNTSDGCIPSDLATDSPMQIEEERRLLYVAMTRARSELHLVHPLRAYVHNQNRHGDRHMYTALTRFIPDGVLPHFERRSLARGVAALEQPSAPAKVVDVASKLRQMW